jgi:S-(hydroxymethyl)glutathione dehydrogenase/alcohol dehydrogenase
VPLAAVMTEVNVPLTIEEIELPEVGAHELLVSWSAAGLCHSDLSVMNGTHPSGLPIVLGHEGVGRVVEVGSGVETLAVGDRVIGSFVTPCGSCFWCLNDQTHLCTEMLGTILTPRVVGSNGAPTVSMVGLGTFSEAMVVNEKSLVKVESDLEDDILALIGCGVTTGVSAALNTARVTPGSSVAVIGCGGVGQAVIQGAIVAGASQIIAIDTVALKRDQALAHGATHVIDPAAVDAVDAVRELTGGRGVDFAFEVIGLSKTLSQAVEMVRKGGTAVMVGAPPIHGELVLPNAFDFFIAEKTLKSSLYGSAEVRRDFSKIIGLIESGRMDVSHMVSRHIHLSDINEGFRSMASGEVIRSVISY